MDVFGAAHAWGSGKHFPLPKIFHTYHTTMKLSSFTLPKSDPGNV